MYCRDQRDRAGPPSCGEVGAVLLARRAKPMRCPPSPLAEQAAEERFLELLTRFAVQGRILSDKPKANQYAPSMFAKKPPGAVASASPRHS